MLNAAGRWKVGPSGPERQLFGRKSRIVGIHFALITPSHNRRQYLPEASLQATISAPLDFPREHLIYENGSTDGTTAWLREAVRQPDHALRYWSHPDTVRAGRARNRLIEQTDTGAWLVPLDDDDVLLQRCLYHYTTMPGWLKRIRSSPGSWPTSPAWTRMGATCPARIITPGTSKRRRQCCRPFSKPSTLFRATCATAGRYLTRSGATTKSCPWPRTSTCTCAFCWPDICRCCLPTSATCTASTAATSALASMPASTARTCG
ncbi:glycosyltransferase family 2 protein [Hymenobacter elongatus]|uniref:Glycosyltransferase family 2 protein n=1 Tax=Hymenobacter elongatus TaxID=877208 RepID=A0A4Z0PN01_9BACT|nr:glycosyltransferase family 2 protein [Hymenobacter elongatus]